MDKRSGSIYTYTYHPLVGECAAFTYVLSKDFATLTNKNFADWQLKAVYQIETKPKQKGFLLNAQGKDRFSHNTTQYPPWDYHRASLLVFAKGDSFTVMIADTFLESTPAYLKDWLTKFDLNSTIFNIIPFQASKQVEGDIKDIDAQNATLAEQGKPLHRGGTTYNPHILRK